MFKISRCLRNIFLPLTTIGITFIVIFLSSGQAHATCSLGELSDIPPGYFSLWAFKMPADKYSYLNDSKCYAASPTSTEWISPSDASYSNTANAQSGSMYVPLWVNVAIVRNINDTTNGNITQENYQISSASSDGNTTVVNGFGGALGNPTALVDISPQSAPVGTAASNYISVALKSNNINGFTAGTKYNVSFNLKKINYNPSQLNGPNGPYECVTGTSGTRKFAKAIDDFNSCDTFTTSISIQVNITPIAYPWLQTRYGDVTSLGYIAGQVLGSATDLNNNIGARRLDASVMEADYVISSVTGAATGVGGNSNFCSNNFYTLGRNLSERNNCKTGGYTAKSIDFNSIRNSLQNAWSANGSGVPPAGSAYAGSCSPYKTYILPNNSMMKTNLSLGCNNNSSLDGQGGIQKVIGDYTLDLSGAPLANTVSGRGTLWVTGDLIISSQIINNSDPSMISDPFNMPNMLIFVEGSVYIKGNLTGSTSSGNVDLIDASIISIGGSNSSKNNNTCYQGNYCANRLINRGYLATENYTNFRRTYFSSSAPNDNPAERIRLTGQSIALPPPGVDMRDAQLGTQLQIDAVELPPRLN